MASVGHALIKSTHLLLLRQVHDGITSAELVHRLGITKQGVSHLVQQLLASGYLRSQPAVNDSRATRLYLSETGQAALSIANELLEQLRQRFDSLIGPSASDTFTSNLAKLAIYTSKAE
jgi:DNA-binding MarR family transcriptional regulator